MKLYCAITIVPIQSFSQNAGMNVTGVPAHPSAMLDVDAAPTNDKGMLVPRVALTITTTNAPIGAGIVTSLLVYNTATANDVVPGYYYWDGTKWMPFQTSSMGPVFITPVVVYSSVNPIGWTTYNASASVPLGSSAVILQVDGSNGTNDVFVYYRVNSSSAQYIAYRSRSAGGLDNFANSCQSTLPISATSTFDYTVTSTPDNTTISIVGYWP